MLAVTLNQKSLVIQYPFSQPPFASVGGGTSVTSPSAPTTTSASTSKTFTTVARAANPDDKSSKPSNRFTVTPTSAPTNGSSCISAAVSIRELVVAVGATLRAELSVMLSRSRWNSPFVAMLMLLWASAVPFIPMSTPTWRSSIGPTVKIPGMEKPAASTGLHRYV